MFYRLVLLFTVVPLLELLLLLEIGRYVGVGPTVALVIATGLLGAALARQQGVGVLRKVREETRAGKLPTGALLDGALILVAGAVLMTPGVLTDLFGFFCLIPAGRRVLRKLIGRRFRGAVERGEVRVHRVPGASAGSGFDSVPGSGKRPVRNVTPTDRRPDS